VASDFLSLLQDRDWLFHLIIKKESHISISTVSKVLL